MAIFKHKYDNGLTLLTEPIGGVASVGMTWLLPAGAAAEPAGKLGVGAVLSEMIYRGAGQLDARAHSDALDILGVNRSSQVQTQQMRVGATFLGDRVEKVLPLMFDVVRRPVLAEKDLDPAVQLALQEIEGLEDEPQDKVMLELKRRHLGEPLGRSTLGEAEHLKKLKLADVKKFAAERFTAGGAILAFAGALEFERLRDKVGELLGDMRGAATPAEETPAKPAGYSHVKAESTQLHIGVAYETVGACDADQMTQHVATAVLSGGMSGRLFTEVREKRGLCYSVYASYSPRKTAGTMYAYSGTTTQRAAETFDVLTAELKKLSDGVTKEEFDRAVVGLQSRLVMQGESTSARARAIAADEFLLGRPRTLDELAAEVEAVTLDKVNRFVANHRPGEMTVVTIGPEKLGNA